eukprot:487273-Lingulodinium_polyedra.AAC.1
MAVPAANPAGEAARVATARQGAHAVAEQSQPAAGVIGGDASRGAPQAWDNPLDFVFQAVIQRTGATGQPV